MHTQAVGGTPPTLAAGWEWQSTHVHYKASVCLAGMCLKAPGCLPGARPASSKGSVVSMTLTATVVPFQLPRYTCGTDRYSDTETQKQRRLVRQVGSGACAAHAVLATLGPHPTPPQTPLPQPPTPKQSQVTHPAVGAAPDEGPQPDIRKCRRHGTLERQVAM
jgi:hypothetical protein